MKPIIHSLILAAGKGTRMKSELPKVVHPILGKPMISYVIEAMKATGASKNIIVTGYKSDIVKASLAGQDLDFVEQAPQLGTGHAVQCYANSNPSRPSHLLVVCGDTPLISIDTLQEMTEIHLNEKPAITMMTLDMKNPGNYGRIIRQNGLVKAIREAKDCSENELLINEVNLAVYLFEADFLFSNIFNLDNKNNQKEYYLTDLIELASKQGLKVIACKEKDENSTLGINSRQHLAQISNILEEKILNSLMDKGVSIINPAQTLIGPDCDIEPDCTIWPGCTIYGNCKIGQNSTIGPNCLITNSNLGKNCNVKFCTIENSNIADNSEVTPFTAIFEKNQPKP